MNASSRVHRIKLIAAAALFGLATALPASAADSVDVTVNATITGVCKFFTADPVLDITNTGTGDEIDPSAAGPAEGEVEITYRCSKGTTPTFTVPLSVVLAGPESMTATLSYTGGGDGTGMGAGQGKTLTVKGSIAQAEYEDKEVGTYTNDVTVEIDP
jgi:hypothetical protein